MKFSKITLLLLTFPMLSGCVIGAAVNVAGETVEAAAEVTGAVVSTTAKTTGAVIGGAADAVIPGDQSGKKDDD